MQVILLERVDSLGELGDVVKVKPGYARNYLIPQSKALRATDDNIAYFEAQKKEIEKQNESKRKDAEKEAKKLEGLKISIIRHASESGQLYGSVAARDIAEVAAEKTGLKIARSMVTIHDAFKTIGLFPVTIALHPEVKIEITVNVARSEDEAKIQEKTGKAMVAEDQKSAETKKAEAEAALEDATSKKEMLEDSALEAEQQKAEDDAKKAVEEEAKAAERAAKKAAQAQAEAEKAEAEAAEAEGEDAASDAAEEEKED
ncbi:MAG: 50S ribosomal protein L9 [Rhodospirillales bacterium]|nr:50S ribosomal protein L9 [Rhodospirillales bacterium]MCB9997158.1 50S ribosomal protein L9 [Rhodospirillales bacterium]